MITSLSEVRRYIASVAETLDPESRYIRELEAIVEASSDVPDLLARLAADSRGARHAGAGVFARMSTEQKLRCNLVTNETVLFRFSEGEWDALQRIVARFAGGAREARVLCAPCSHGEEAFSVAAACLQAGASFTIDACDIQPECVAEARLGRMTMGFPDAWLETPAIVARPVLDRIRFAVGDLLAAPGEGAFPEGSWDLIVCRNFLGYFRESIAVGVATTLASRIQPGGALFLDSFCVAKFPALAPALAHAGVDRQGASPVFQRS